MNVRLSDQAQRQLHDAPAELRRSAARAIDRLAAVGVIAGARVRQHGVADLWAIRACRKYRLLYTRDGGDILVIELVSRGDKRWYRSE